MVSRGRWECDLGCLGLVEGGCLGRGGGFEIEDEESMTRVVLVLLIFWWLFVDSWVK